MKIQFTGQYNRDVTAETLRNSNATKVQVPRPLTLSNSELTRRMRIADERDDSVLFVQQVDENGNKLARLREEHAKWWQDLKASAQAKIEKRRELAQAARGAAVCLTIAVVAMIWLLYAFYPK